MENFLLDPNLFGNQAGEDEDKRRLCDYYLEKERYNIFFEPDRKVEFVRSRKGVGKSALLNYTAEKIKDKYTDDIIINIKATELIALHSCEEYLPLQYENCWKQRICLRILNELAKYINFAVSDDSMKIIENSEIMGFKGKNIVSALADRLKIGVEGMLSLEKKQETAANGYELLKRYSEKKNQKVWLLVDDIDATFVNSQENMIVIGTFFTACRNLVSTVNGLVIRASVRTDVWTILRNNDEALDKCEQYMIDLSWSTQESGEILYNKIYSYFYEKGLITFERNFKENQKRVFDLVFSGYIKWGNKTIIPYRPIHILSAGRPRWAAQLCAIAASDAKRNNRKKIATANIYYAMTEYGQKRMADLYKEHNHQCTELNMIIESFRGGESSYHTNDLLKQIEEKILSREENVYIDNKKRAANKYEIARFLYRIGFITLRNDELNKALGLTKYEDDPYLLSEYNLDEKQIWEIHPAYRTVLRIKEFY